MKNQCGIMKNHENRPGTMENRELPPGTMKNHENEPGIMKNQPGTWNMDLVLMMMVMIDDER